MTKPMIRCWDEYCRSVQIGHVNVSQDKGLDTMKPERPQINWSAIGAVHPKEAKAFLRDLDTGLVLAEILWANRRIPWTHPMRHPSYGVVAPPKKIVVQGNRVGLTRFHHPRAMTLWFPRWDKPEDQK